MFSYKILDFVRVTQSPDSLKQQNCCNYSGYQNRSA